MGIVFFNNILAALGKRVNYDAVVNFAGNSFAKDAWKTIQEANPLIKHKQRHAFADMFSEVAIKQTKIIPVTESGKKLGDISDETVGDVTDTAKDMFNALRMAVQRS
jgi:hypothetical protein